MLGTTFTLAVRSILRHKLRSFLTTLGIIIGVAAVVTMVTLGKATTVAVQQQIAALGTNILQVLPGQGFGRGGGGPRPPDFEMADVEAIREQIAGVAAVAPTAQASATAIFNGANWSTQINGTTNAFFQIQPWKLSDGRLFSPAEEQAGKAVCILGNTVVTNLFRSGGAVGSRIRVGNVSCDVVATLQPRGQAGFGGDQDNVIIMPIKTVQRRFTGNRDIRAILVGVDADYQTSAVQASLTSLLQERRRIQPGQDDNFFIFDSRQFTDTFTQTTQLLTTIVTAVAAISLIVGGIGIMNIMLVSVTERTREIGIRLAIGAVGREVLTQFLVEAIVLSMLGGIMGLLLAQLAIGLIAPLAKLPWLFDPAINIGAFAISALIGVVFGFFPARRAAALNPIDALRHE
ncbi:MULTISPECIES: ABC transporter permease [unclassified Sphingomonas]|jgi:putative ABC transport system permease protein|uniref:ABC transporter permease n=1 Tax=unclassified Sphingomonas TaxID=196159 RepID=UPI000829D227|nr:MULTISPECIES: ABC transporter permease [unclassified Sphingomonas]